MVLQLQVARGGAVATHRSDFEAKSRSIDRCSSIPSRCSEVILGPEIASGKLPTRDKSCRTIGFHPNAEQVPHHQTL